MLPNILNKNKKIDADLKLLNEITLPTIQENFSEELGKIKLQLDDHINEENDSILNNDSAIRKSIIKEMNLFIYKILIGFCLILLQYLKQVKKLLITNQLIQKLIKK